MSKLDPAALDRRCARREPAAVDPVSREAAPRGRPVTGPLADDSATFVSDPKYAGVSLQELVDADNAASHEEKLTYLFLADATTMADVERPLLALDLADEPGRTFRVPPRWYADVSANLAIANMDFAEFADAVDRSDTYRCFDGE